MPNIATCFLYYKDIVDRSDEILITSHAYFTASEPNVFLVVPSGLAIQRIVSIFMTYRPISTINIVVLDELFGSRALYNQAFYECTLAQYLSRLSYSNYLIIQDDVLLLNYTDRFYHFFETRKNAAILVLLFTIKENLLPLMVVYLIGIYLKKFEFPLII